MTDRRTFLGSLAAASLLPLVGLSRNAWAFDRPLLFQSHSLRDWFIADFAGTLRELKEVGYSGLELTSFHGFRGNFRGDYGALTDLPPAVIRKTIEDAGLTCTSSHFLAEEFAPDRFGQAVAWAQGVGLRYMVLTGLPAAGSAAEWQRNFALLNETGERVRREGLQLGFHTDASVWTQVEGRLVMDEMLASVPAENCLQQLDLAGVVEHEVDAGAYMARHPGRFFWLHIRDGVKPEQPGTYIPALVPGEGVIDWASVFRGARDAGVAEYIVEMQVRPVSGSMDAFRRSYEVIRGFDF